MKKILTCVTLFIAVCVLSGFSSCSGPQYEESERIAVEDEGKAIMKEWLDKHMMGSEVLSAEAYIDMVPSGPEYLTDSVYGTFSKNGEERRYEVEVEEKEIYLECDKSLLSGLIKPYVLDQLELSERADECSFSDFTVRIIEEDTPYSGQRLLSEGYVDAGYLPAELVLKLENVGADMSPKEGISSGGEESSDTGTDGNAKEEEPKKSAKTVSPEEDDLKSGEDSESLNGDESEEVSESWEESLEKSMAVWGKEACALMDDFIRNPKNRPMITVSGYIAVPKDIGLKKYNMAYFDALKDEAGLYCNYVYLEKDLEFVSAWGWYTEYEHFAKVPFEDFMVEFQDEYLGERSREGKITVEEQYTKDANNLIMTKTNDGYSFSFKDPEKRFIFSIFSDGSSELNEHEYIARFDNEANLGPGEKYSGDRYWNTELHWEKLEDGSFTLMREDGTIYRFSFEDKLIIRD